MVSSLVGSFLLCATQLSWKILNIARAPTTNKSNIGQSTRFSSKTSSSLSSSAGRGEEFCGWMVKEKDFVCIKVRCAEIVGGRAQFVHESCFSFIWNIWSVESIVISELDISCHWKKSPIIDSWYENRLLLHQFEVLTERAAEFSARKKNQQILIGQQFYYSFFQIVISIEQLLHSSVRARRKLEFFFLSPPCNRTRVTLTRRAPNEFAKRARQ